jgi:hypothetical protein
MGYKTAYVRSRLVHRIVDDKLLFGTDLKIVTRPQLPIAQVVVLCPHESSIDIRL